MIRLYTDASFIVRSQQAQIGLAVVVRDDARIVSRIQQAYTDPALSQTKSLSGENNNLAELRACLLGFEHLASLKAQGWVWNCHRVDYTTDSSWVVDRLRQALGGGRAPLGEVGEVGEVLGLIRAAWERAGVTEVRVLRQSDRLCQNIRDCDNRSKRARNTMVAPDPPPKPAPKPKVPPKPPSRKNKKKKWRYGR